MSDFTLRHVPKDDLAHYALACTDIEYAFPWGAGEVEGIAHRGSYDLDVCLVYNNMYVNIAHVHMFKHTYIYVYV